MSATRQVTIWCDGTGCARWTGATEGDTVTEARRAARRRGWRTGVTDTSRPLGNNARLDFCPECKESRP